MSTGDWIRLGVVGGLGIFTWIMLTFKEKNEEIEDERSKN